jgi:hypothetical protein
MIPLPLPEISDIFTSSTLAKLAESKLLKNTKPPQLIFSDVFVMMYNKSYI